MDTSGTPYDGGLMNDLPLGFTNALAMNEAALVGYGALSEAEREELILRCKGVKTKDEMQKIVDSLAPGVDIHRVYEEERGNFI